MGFRFKTPVFGAGNNVLKKNKKRHFIRKNIKLRSKIFANPNFNTGVKLHSDFSFKKAERHRQATIFPGCRQKNVCALGI